MNDSRTNLVNDALTNYTWSFGDATPNGVQNTPLPSFIAHRYATTGVYNTILSVTDANGCIDTATVRVAWLPEPINPFTVPDQQSCDYQQFLQFTNATQPSAYGIRWQFGDGAVSTTSSPQHIYGTYGVYTATVSVTSGPQGFCTFRDTAIITVHQLPTAAYRFRYDSCAIGDVLFANDSRSNLANDALTSFTWSYGDASPNGVQNTPLANFITHRYSTRATYPTVLTVTDVNGCIDTAQVTVPWLPEPINPFTLPDQQACDYRQLLSFNNAIQPTAYNIRWQFGDGAVSTTNNPSHSYNRFGVYTATVSVTSGPQGFCTFRDTAIVTIHQLPTASYRFRYDSCAIGDVRLENTSRTNAAGNPFASYRWDFGDTNIGLQNTLPLPNFISHTYATRGTYPTSLLATDINGCTATASVIVPWVPEPIPLIVMPDQALCDRDTFRFNSPAMPFGYRINWNFGDGTPSSSLQSPSHVYSQFGRYTATVAVNSAPQGFCQSFYQANIEVRELPRPSSLGVTPTLCFGSTDGAIVSQVQGGRAPYSYAWSNNLSTSNISGIAAGAYILTVTDTYGCSGVSTPITVTQPDLITGIVTRRQNISCHSVCDGQLEILARGGNGTYSYAWDSGQTTSAISGLCAGAYNLVITDQNNCLGYMNNVTVTQPAPLRALAAGTNVRCFGESSGQVAAITQGGTYPYFYRWNTQPVDLDSVANNLPIGTYTVNVLDNNGCTTTASATIVQPSQLVASVTADTVSCFGTPDGTAQIRSIIGGTSPYQVSWDNNNTGLFTSLLTGGPHQVTISDNIGCQIVLPFTVVSPNPILVFTTNIRNVSCHGFSDGYLAVNPQGGVSGGYSYIWNNGLFGMAQLNNLRAGQYSVTVSDSNGCTGTQQNIVVTEPAPITLTVVSTIGRVTCHGDATGALLASASGGTPSYNYFWNGGARTAALTGLVAGTYTVSATDANGCTAATVSGVITEPVPLSVGVTATDPICFNTLGNIELAVDLNTGTPNFRISFDGGNTFTRTTAERYVYAGAPDGTYNIVVRDANSCPYFTTVTLVEPLEILLTMPANQQIVLGDSILLPTSILNAIGNPTYLWSPIDGSLSCFSCDSPTAQPTRTTEYSLLVTDANGCRASGNVSVEVDRARRVFIPNAFTPNDDGQNDFFVPEGGTDVDYVESMIIADRWGGIIFTNNNFQVGNRQSGWNGEMNGEELNTGVYVYMITIRFKDGNSEVFKGDVTLLR